MFERWLLLGDDENVFRMNMREWICLLLVVEALSLLLTTGVGAFVMVPPTNNNHVNCLQRSQAAVLLLHEKQQPTSEELSFRLNETSTSSMMELIWCGEDHCQDDLRERVVGDHNHIVLSGPATGQVAYYWNETAPKPSVHCVLLLVKIGSEALLTVAAETVRNLTAALGPHQEVQILLEPVTAARLKHYHGVDGKDIHLFEPMPCPGFGDNPNLEHVENSEMPLSTAQFPDQVPQHSSPDLIVTLGGDGLLMHAAMLFQGSVPPILAVSGGSLGFLTSFKTEEIVEAIQVALGILVPQEDAESSDDIQVFPPNMHTMVPAYEKQRGFMHSKEFPLVSNQICLSIRMRLDCRIINRQGAIRARYNVLNEVVVDRGSSPYLAALECFCDDVHLTTVQADGVIFATPTGSTAYSLAAGSSVVHPGVPSILVTPVCAHVLSFRSMVFPDHVVLRCFVPDDARAEASVAFDGKHRQSLRRGDSIQIKMSAYPVPTINRKDHSSDWLDSLKRNFNFNVRPRQQPL